MSDAEHHHILSIYLITSWESVLHMWDKSSLSCSLLATGFFYFIKKEKLYCENNMCVLACNWRAKLSSLQLLSLFSRPKVVSASDTRLQKSYHFELVMQLARKLLQLVLLKAMAVKIEIMSVFILKFLREMKWDFLKLELNFREAKNE